MPRERVISDMHFCMLGGRPRACRHSSATGHSCGFQSICLIRELASLTDLLVRGPSLDARNGVEARQGFM
eukprot:366561-Chlamydomonas_euryale.AAC.7